MSHIEIEWTVWGIYTTTDLPGFISFGEDGSLVGDYEQFNPYLYSSRKEAEWAIQNLQLPDDATPVPLVVTIAEDKKRQTAPWIGG